MNSNNALPFLNEHAYEQSTTGVRGLFHKLGVVLPGFVRRRLGILNRLEWQRVLDEELFDVVYYLENNPQVIQSGGNPWLHYCRKGWKEHQNPSPRFSTSRYLDVRPDVARAGICPLIHYCICGAAEGARRFPVPPVSTGMIQTKGDERAARRSRSIRTILFVSGEGATPGHKYRINALQSALPEDLYDVNVITLEDVIGGWTPQPGTRVALCWLWRCRMTPELDRFLDLIRGQNGVIHSDVDDLMFQPELIDEDQIDGVRSMKLDPEESKQLFLEHLMTLSKADQCSSPTEPLCRAMRGHGFNSYLVPNGFTHGDFRKARAAGFAPLSDGLFRMGYACGSRTHQRDFSRILPGIVRFLERHPEARLVVYPEAFLLEEFPELVPHEHQLEKRDLVPVEDLILEYARYDVNLAPVEVGNRFCEAKSQLKFFEAALVKTPTIASPTQPFRIAIEHGETGFLADTAEEWEEALEICISDLERRKTIGANAYRSVLWSHSQDRQQWLLERVITAGVEHQALASHAQANLFMGCVPDALYSYPARSGTETLFESRLHPQATVTLVMPVYNYAHYLVEALDSVNAQTLESLDVVIVDDGSTDDSVQVALEWMEAHAERFGVCKVLRHTKNQKLGAARNTAIDAAETEFYFPLDPDNILMPDCLEHCLNTLEEKRVSAAFPKLEIFGVDRYIPDVPVWDAQRFVNGNYIDAMAMIRKSVWTVLGGYATDPELLGWEDYDFWCKMAENGFRAKRALEAVARYRAHDESMLATITDEDAFKTRVQHRMEQRHPWLRLSEL